MSLSFVLLAAACFDVVAQPASPLVFDTFTGADHTRLSAHPPDVNQPGGPWTLGMLGPFPEARSWGLSTDTPVPGDYDGDGKTDAAIFRPSTGRWSFLQSSTNYTTSYTVSWGLSTDVPVPGDYDGDGKTDPAIFRPSTGLWAILKSGAGYGVSSVVPWGLSSDVPVPGDYDGDHKTDPAVYRPSIGAWYWLKSSTSYTNSDATSWGRSGDVPVPRDYDGDGKTDPAIFRPSTGLWSILESHTSFTTTIRVSWGLSTDVPVLGDYDGDGKADPAVYRPSTGTWYVLESRTGYTSSGTYATGLAGTPVPGDYNGDGVTDPAAFDTTGTWRVAYATTAWLRGGEVAASPPGLSYAFETIDTPRTTVSVSADWRLGGIAPTWAGVVVRYSDPDNFLLAQYRDGVLGLYQRQNGVWAPAALASAPVPTSGAGVHRIRVDVADTADALATPHTVVRVFGDGVLQEQATLPVVSGTRAGLAWNGYDPTATADNFEMSSNGSPTVSVAVPASAGPFAAPATIPVQAIATDPDGTIDHVAFFANGAPIGSASTAPYTATLRGVGVGTVTFTAIAYDNGGAATTSAPIAVTVDPHCSHVTVTPQTLTIGPEGGSAIVTVTTQSDCPWSASSGTWATRASGASRTGSGSVTYMARSNYTLAARTETVTVGGQAIALTQSGLDPTAVGVLDTFTASDGMPLHDRQPDVAPGGTTWAVRGGAPLVIAGDRAGPAGPGDGVAVGLLEAAIETGISDGVIAATFHPAASGTRSGYPMGAIMFRRTGPLEFWVAGFGIMSYQFSLWRITPGHFFDEPVAYAAIDDVVGSAHQLEVRLSGPVIEVWLDGTRRLQTADWTGWSSGTHGLQFQSDDDWLSRFDNFMVQAPCVTALTPSTTTLPAEGGAGTVNVIAPPGCGWAPVAVGPWLTIDGWSVADGTIHYHVDENRMWQTRTATIYVGGHAAEVSQPSVAAPDDSPCVPAISPPSQNRGRSASAGSFSVIVPEGCWWRVESASAPWLGAELLGTPLLNSRTVQYGVTENTTGAPRSGAITIRDLQYGVARNFGVDQSAVDDTGGTCAYTVSPNFVHTHNEQGTVVVAVTTAPGCPITPIAYVPWVTPTSAPPGSPPGTIGLRIHSNPAQRPRSGLVGIGGAGVLIFQAVSGEDYGDDCWEGPRYDDDGNEIGDALYCDENITVTGTAPPIDPGPPPAPVDWCLLIPGLCDEEPPECEPGSTCDPPPCGAASHALTVSEDCGGDEEGPKPNVRFTRSASSVPATLTCTGEVTGQAAYGVIGSLKISSPTGRILLPTCEWAARSVPMQVSADLELDEYSRPGRYTCEGTFRAATDVWQGTDHDGVSVSNAPCACEPDFNGVDWQRAQRGLDFSADISDPSQRADVTAWFLDAEKMWNPEFASFGSTVHVRLLDSGGMPVRIGPVADRDRPNALMSWNRRDRVMTIDPKVFTLPHNADYNAYVKTLIAHEIGHALGMEHSSCRQDKSIMAEVVTQSHDILPADRCFVANEFRSPSPACR